MKCFWVLVVFVTFCELTTVSRGFKNEALKRAFVNISSFLAEENYLLTIIVVGKTTTEASKSIILPLTSEIPHLVYHIQKEIYKFELESSAIATFDSVASLKRFNDYCYVSMLVSVSEQIFIHLLNAKYADILEVEFENQDLFVVKLQYFVLEEEELIRLLTFVMYEPGKCGIPQLVEVNRFDKSTAKWQHGIFKIDKFSNFNGCELKFLIGDQVPHYILDNFDNDTRIVSECGGYACAVLRDFASVLNYTRKMILYHEAMRRHFIPQYDLNFRATAMSVILIQNELNGRFVEVFTRPVYTFEKFIAIPPGPQYNGYEKMVLPFDDWTWKLIGITFASAFATIFLLRFARSDITHFMIGRRTETPTLNVLRIFFGISQASCPGRNFARYLLMMFILFSLVIRTAYQGKMFEFLQKEIRKPTVTSIDEMIDQNFTFFVDRTFRKFNNDSDIAKRGIIKADWTNEEQLAAYKSLYNPGTRIGFIYYFEMHLDFMEDGLDAREPPKFLKDRYMLDSMAFVFPSFHFLFKTFDLKLQQYIEADLINYNIRAWQEDLKRKMFTQKEPFAVLTLGELEAGFVVWLVPLLLSVLAFAIEWLVVMKNLMFFLSIFKTFFEAKELEQANYSNLMKVKFAAWQEIWQKQKKIEKGLAAKQAKKNQNKFYMSSV